MAPRSVDAMEAAVFATGLLDLGASGAGGHVGDVGVGGGAGGHVGDVGVGGGAGGHVGDVEAGGGAGGHVGDVGARIRGGPLLLLCSAGRDSACLLDLAVRRRGADGVRVLHVDHGLRAESASEAKRVRAAGAALGVDVVVRHAGDAPPNGNLHAWARAERARFAAEEAARLGAAAIATAHTRTDLVETALFRLATQPGRRALLAMRPFEPRSSGHAGDAGAAGRSSGHAGGVGDGAPLVRPLLELSRDETLAYCLARDLIWTDDASNADRRFARARLRHSVTPVLRSLNPRFEESVARTLRELTEEREALDALVDRTLPSGSSELSAEVLAALPRPVGRLVLRELCERVTSRPCARAAGRLDEVLARAAASGAPFALDVGDGARVVVRRGVVRVERSSGPAAPR